MYHPLSGANRALDEKARKEFPTSQPYEEIERLLGLHSLNWRQFRGELVVFHAVVSYFSIGVTKLERSPIKHSSGP